MRQVHPDAVIISELCRHLSHSLEIVVRLSMKIAVNKFKSPNAPITPQAIKMSHAAGYTFDIGLVIPDIQLSIKPPKGHAR